MFPLYGCIIALIIEMANNNMKSFKQYLTEDAWYKDQWMEDNLEQLKADEGFKPKAYQIWIIDPKTNKKKLDKITIGYGANLEDPATKKIMASLGMNAEDYMSGEKSISEREAELLLRQQQGQAISDVFKQTPISKTNKLSILADPNMPDEAKNTATNLMYQLGQNNFNQFKKFKEALANKDFETAALELQFGKTRNEKSGIMIQTPDRTTRHQMRLRSINNPNLRPPQDPDDELETKVDIRQPVKHPENNLKPYKRPK